MMKCAQGSASARQGSRTVDWRIVDPELSPREIAAEAGISLRYLQKLFTQRGSTCSGLIDARIAVILAPVIKPPISTLTGLHELAGGWLGRQGPNSEISLIGGTYFRVPMTTRYSRGMAMPRSLR
jgi:hypothetical protein